MNLNNTITNLKNIAEKTYGDFRQIASENRKILERGSVLDLNNHPSYDRK